jgi:RNA polymerase sigma factor for flagellar operon FliA
MSDAETLGSGPRRRRQRGEDAGLGEAELVEQALPLVHYVVSDIARRVPRSVQRQDLVSAGMLGLTQAARSWDPARGVSFESFARNRIRGAMLDELRGLDWAPRSVRARGRAMQRATDELARAVGRTPTTAEVARHMGVDEEVVERLTDDVRRATVLAFDSPEADVLGSCSSPDAGPAEVLLSRELRSYLADAVVALPERLRKVVVEYFFEERQLQDIASDLGVTESRVSQMRAEALALLKDGINSQLAPEEVPDLAVTTGRVGKRKSAYYSAVAAASDYRSRLDAANATTVGARLARLA